MTIKQIAEQANISIGTVDRVLHHRGGVNKETEELVLRIAREHGYQANQFARNLKLGKQYHFAILLPYFQSESNYWELVHTGIEKAAKELSSLSVHIDYYPFDRTKRKEFGLQLEALLSHHPDALLLAPPGKEEMQELVSLKDLPPTCTIDSSSPLFSPISAIAQDPYRGGFIAGKMSRLLAKGNGRYVCLQIHPDAFNSMERARGFHDNIAEDGKDTVIDFTFLHPEDPTELDDLYKEHDDIIGIFTTNSITCTIADYLESHHLRKKVTLVGYDLVPQNKEALEKGTIDCIISQRPAYQGYVAVNQLYKHVVLGQNPDKKTEIPIDIFFKENLIETDD